MRPIASTGPCVATPGRRHIPSPNQRDMTEFADLGLSPTILQAIIDSGYTTATPIQEQAIPVALAGLDVLGIAQTGTGKTAAFTLPMIEKLSSGRAKARMPRALVIAPTRELADQVSLAFERYAKGTKLTWALLIGGVSFGDQQMKLDRGVDVLIATPGRLLDHFERGKLLLTGVQIMVVDEADRMLDMGFIPDIERIFKLVPFTRQTLFFSATMPMDIRALADRILRNPLPIQVDSIAPAATVAHSIYPTTDRLRKSMLETLLRRVATGTLLCGLLLGALVPPWSKQLLASGAEILCQRSSLRFTTEEAAEEAEEFEIVLRNQRVGDDDMRHEAGERLDLLAAVLVDVHDEVGGCGSTDFFDVGILGAAHLGDALDGLARMDAKAAAADDIVRESEVAEQFGEAGDEADDAQGAFRRHMEGAEGVAKFGACGRHGGFYDARFPLVRE